jgi:hypothetical protein
MRKQRVIREHRERLLDRQSLNCVGRTPAERQEYKITAIAEGLQLWMIVGEAARRLPGLRTWERFVASGLSEGHSLQALADMSKTTYKRVEKTKRCVIQKILKMIKEGAVMDEDAEWLDPKEYLEKWRAWEQLLNVTGGVQNGER